MAGRARRLAVVCLAAAAIAACASPSDDGTTPDSRRANDVDTTVVASAPLTLEGRISQSVADAADRGADVTIALLDRRDGHYESFADTTPFATASVAKLFIADDIFYRETIADLELTADQHALVARMLEYSDDDAANQLWDEYGASDIVLDVVSRYGLADTSVPYDDHWWNTTTTGRDLVDYYAAVLDGRGGLDAAHRDEMMAYLRTSSPTAADGYDQSFGIPAGLPDETDVAVKQGWMCCVDDRWMHLSTGVIGPDGRYVLVLVSREDLDYGDSDAEYPDTSLTAAVDDVSAAHARETVTDVARTLFPQRRID
ncbi:serine hydrolase [Prescottella agglutinans]|uniref:serine hydrolase n=1 Tax=Prescottella agglutinans TaxID=1644129 RepID=UPI001F4EA233|nr:serine hydrolase [Prescottella agglutinans]